MIKHFSLSIFFLFLLAMTIQAQEDCCAVNTITTIGTSTVNITPDIAQISITANGNGTVSAAALSQVNTLINSLLAIFKSLNISATDYSTSSISITQQFNYSYSPYQIVGAIAQQTIILTVKNLSNLGNIIKSISNVNVQIDYLQYYSSNPQASLSLARKAAFAEALNKFKQYLALTGLSNAGLKKIIDLNSESFYPLSTSYAQFLIPGNTITPNKSIQASASVQGVWATKKKFEPCL
jgi:uncharacterized protein YggE